MTKRFLVFYILAAGLVAIVGRLLPHPANFAPIGALALFCGAYLAKQNKRWLLFPLVAMVFSDIVIGFYDWKIMAIVYASFLAYGLIGTTMAGPKSVKRFAVGTVAGSLLFFFTTNFAVWAFSSLYPKTIEGLMLAYALAIPFFQNTLAGDLFFFALFAGGYELAVSRIRERIISAKIATN